MLAAVAERLGPLSAWLAQTQPESHQALFDADRAVFPALGQAPRLWRKASTPLDTLRAQVWERAWKNARAAAAESPPILEIQRSGLLGHPELHGVLFPALCLAAEGGPLPPEQSQSHDRYYAQLETMPGDVDSAAAIALHGGPAHLLPAALERLRWALAQERVPVWQGEGWFGPICAGVSGRALSAAARHGIPVNSAILAHLGALRPWARATHYPDPLVASVLVAQGLRDQGQPHRALERMMASAPTRQWSPLGTASVASFMGPALSLRRREQLLVRLLELQRWDGSFPPSPWYLVPALHGGMQVFGSATLNTWAALRALEGLRPRPVADLR